jgi:hypothetical protein
MDLHIETICGGKDAAGGGCGAPRGVRKVSKEVFEATRGPVASEPFEHCDHECDFEGGQVKLTFSACSGCSSYV